MFVRRIYFRFFTNPRFTTSLDLGCNTGVVTAVLRQLGGANGRVVAIDASAFPESRYRKELAASGGIEFDQRVLCGKSTRADPTKLAALCAEFGFDPARAATVADIMNNHRLDHVDFMKMDIEGAEFGIFADSGHWLDRIDNLAMEVHPKKGNPLFIIQRLKDSGFTVRWCDGFGYPIPENQAAYIYASKVDALDI